MTNTTTNQEFKAGSFTLNGPKTLSFQDLQVSIAQIVAQGQEGNDSPEGISKEIMRAVELFISVECPGALN